MKQDLFADLDAQQAEAVRSLRGPVKIIAGAGSGKTLTVTRRIAYGISQQEYAPQEIMALSFTRRAAVQLQNRLALYGVTGVYAATFHQAALSQLRFFWEFLHGSPPRQIVQNKLSLLQEAAESRQLAFPDELLSEVAAEIEWAKQNGHAIDEYDQVAAGRPLAARSCQAGNLMLAYEELKNRRKLIDFEDILALTVGLLSAEPSAMARVRDRFRVFTVDEFQDISPLQFELLRLWLGRRRDICVVGDPNQSIYSFAGAKPEYLVNFAEYFPGAHEVSLVANYRCVPEIVNLSNRVIDDYSVVSKMPGGQPQPVIYQHFATMDQEVEFIANQLIDAPAGCAVLYRAAFQGERLARALERRQIIYRTQDRQGYYDIPAVQTACKRIVEKAQTQELSAEQIVREVIESIYSRRPPGFTAEYEGWAALEALRLQAEKFTGTASAFAAQLLENQRLLQPPPIPFVTLATLHATKGLEWERVYLMGVSEELLPHPESDEAEERRLFYVGVTRAKSELIITSSQTPSRYLSALDLAAR